MTAKRRAKRQAPPKKRKGGIPPHEPTDATRLAVACMSAEGVSQERIAEQIGIDPTTLRRHYPDQLDHGHDFRMRKVKQTAFEMATRGDTPAMTIFVLKTQAGWRETDATATPDTGEVTIRRTRSDGSSVEVRVGPEASITPAPEGA